MEILIRRLQGAAPEALCAGLGQDWAMRDAYHNMHACCQYGHATVEAIEIAGEAYPKAPGVFQRLLALDPSLLQSGWAEVVKSFAARA